jgi:hypothetical protein
VETNLREADVKWLPPDSMFDYDTKCETGYKEKQRPKKSCLQLFA